MTEMIWCSLLVSLRKKCATFLDDRQGEHENGDHIGASPLTTMSFQVADVKFIILEAQNGSL